MAALPEGVYRFENVSAAKRLDLSANTPAEGARIQIWAANDTTAQEWRITNQTPPGSNTNIFTIQSNNDSAFGNGFFAARVQNARQAVVYTRRAWTVTFTDLTNNVYEIHFVRGSQNLVLGIVDTAQSSHVELQNRVAGDAGQQWRAVRVRDL